MPLPRFKAMNLQWKLGLFILMGILLWLLNFPVFYVQINHLNEGIVNLELMEDLYNTILEIRRYEKNYFLYQSRESLEDAARYLAQAEQALENSAFRGLPGPAQAASLDLAKHLKAYQSMLQDLRQGRGTAAVDESIQPRLRVVGKETLDLAEGLLKGERQRLGVTATRSWRWPLIVMGLMFVLFLGGATLVFRKVVNPLAQLERATQKIARGDFTAIPHKGRMESQVDHLIAAFNRMTAELEAWQEQSIHSRKIASLGTLVSGIAHELNNPINNIVLSVDSLVSSRAMSEERRATLLEDILKQALRASAIVKGLLDFSRAETSSLHEMDLVAVLRETIHIAANQIAVSRIRLHDEIPEELPAITGSRQGLQQVFLNMIVNAVQAMPSGGDLTIRASHEPGGRIVVKVIDTGVGISEENLEHIFDPFFTTKEVGKGTGMGLSVSYGIIKKHGGQISVTSKTGKGTAFTVEIPVREPAGRA